MEGDAEPRIFELIKNKFDQKSGIVYCRTIKDCKELFVKLIDHGISADLYHGSREDKDKKEVQGLWMRNEIKVMVSTIAFGMGINKKDVRFVIHYTMASSMESYIQETGRAGRDGLESHCVMFYNLNKDSNKIRSLINCPVRKPAKDPVTREEKLLAY